MPGKSLAEAVSQKDAPGTGEGAEAAATGRGRSGRGAPIVVPICSILLESFPTFGSLRANICKYMQIVHEDLRYLRGGIVLLEQRGRFDMVCYYHLHPFTYILVGFHRGNPVFTNQPVGKVRLCKVPPNSLGEFYGF